MYNQAQSKRVISAVCGNYSTAFKQKVMNRTKYVIREGEFTNFTIKLTHFIFPLIYLYFSGEVMLALRRQ